MLLLTVLDYCLSSWLCCEGVTQVGSSSSPSMNNQVGAPMDPNGLVRMNQPVICRGAQILDRQLRDHRNLMESQQPVPALATSGHSSVCNY